MATNDSVEALAEATSAAVGGLVSMTCTYPLDLVKTRLALQQRVAGGARPTLLSAARALVEEKGISGLYQGCEYKVFQSMLSKFCYYYSATSIRGFYQRRVGPLTVPVELALGVLAELSHVPLTMPVEVLGAQVQIAAALQDGKTAVTAGDAAGVHAAATSVAASSGQLATQAASRMAKLWRSITQIYADHGLSGFYQGLRPYLCLVALPAIQQTVFERMKAWVLTRRAKVLGGHNAFLTVFEAFWIGAFARAVAVTILYPYTRAKLAIQASNRKKDQNLHQRQLEQAKELAAVVAKDYSQQKETLNQQAEAESARTAARDKQGSKDVDELSNLSVHGLLLQLVQKDGFSTLYRGLSADLIRRTASAALMLAVKEKLHLYTRAVIYYIFGRSAPISASASAGHA